MADSSSKALNSFEEFINEEGETVKQKLSGHFTVLEEHFDNQNIVVNKLESEANEVNLSIILNFYFYFLYKPYYVSCSKLHHIYSYSYFLSIILAFNYYFKISNSKFSILSISLILYVTSVRYDRQNNSRHNRRHSG